MKTVERLLRAFGSCQAIVAKSFARAHGIDFHNFLVILEGDLDLDGLLKGNPASRRFALLSSLQSTRPKAKLINLWSLSKAAARSVTRYSMA
jgi:hypothetical protein